MAETIRSVLDKTTEYFNHHGIKDTPRLDAEVLLANLLNMERIELYVNINRPMSGQELDDFREIIKMRARRIPVPYITGVKEFMSSQYKVCQDVLIPRPETEILIESICDYVNKFQIHPQICMDMGTGSGVIAIELAKQYNASKIIAVDISKDAIRVARENAKSHGVLEQIEFCESNLFESIPQYIVEGGIDLLVSNPPYVCTAEVSNLQPEISRYEPVFALDGGKDGYKFFKRICKEGMKYFRKGTIISFEVGLGQAASVGKICKDSGFNSVQLFNDYAGKERVVIARM